MKRVKSCIVVFMCMILFMQGIIKYPVSGVHAGGNNGYLVCPTSASEVHKTAKVFDKIPLTFDAEIQITCADNVKGGCIMGSYYKSRTSDAFFFQTYEYGVPGLSYYDAAANKYYTYKFDQLDVRSTEPVRVTIVREESEVVCYVDGVAKQRVSVDGNGVSVSEGKTILPELEAVVGGDNDPNNPRYFKGSISYLNVWADVRTSTEVAQSVDYTDEKLIAAYDFRTGVNPEKDLSGNGYDLSGNLNIVQDGYYANTPLTQGLGFSQEYRYSSENEIQSDTYTLSAWVYIPTSMSEAAGIVMGNYFKGTIAETAETSFNFSFAANGVPRFFHVNDQGEDVYVDFTNVDARAGEWTHYAITVDATTKQVDCYLNGELKESKTATKDLTLQEVDAPLALGGCQRYSNIGYFKGKILESALYKTVLTADEIKDAYLNGVDKNDTDLIGLYNLEDANESDDILDLSGNNNHMFACDRYFSDKEEVTDYAYSFAIVGDTQKLTYYDYENNTTHLADLHDWIVENKEEKKIEYVIGLGDITDKDLHEEWAIAKDAISKLDGQLDYSLIRGNHDAIQRNSTTGAITRDRFSYYMGTDAYKSQFANGGFMDENLSNSWRTMKIGNVNYLMLNLDWHLEDEVIAWADNIISSHPQHNVIVTVHTYLNDDGELLTVPGNNGDTRTGEDLWNDLISKHKNIVMVLSGHIGTDDIVMKKQTGVHGNTVTSFLINPQNVDRDEGPTGMVAMFYFSEDGKNVQVEYISTVRDEYFLESSQFDFELAVVEAENTLPGGNQSSGGQGGNSSTSSGNGQSSGNQGSGSQGNSNSSTIGKGFIGTGDNAVMLGWVFFVMAAVTGFGIHLVVKKAD